MRQVQAYFMISCLLLASCEHGHNANHNHEHKHEHHHIAPHGGVLVELGDHFAHIELCFNAAEGVIDLYILDKEAETALVPDQSSVLLELSEPALKLELKAVASALTGETTDKSSHLAAQNDALKGLGKILGRLTSLTVKGQKFTEIAVEYPESTAHESK